MTNKVSITRVCQRVGRRSDYLLPSGTVFLCSEGLEKHWQIGDTTRKLEIRLHNQKPTRNAHKFTTSGPFCSAIHSKPEKGESWFPANHGVYSHFGIMMAEYKRAAGTDTGWMEVSILE